MGMENVSVGTGRKDLGHDYVYMVQNIRIVWVIGLSAGVSG